MNASKNGVKSPRRLPATLLRPLKAAVLGARYDLSVVLIDSVESQRLNRLYRGKNKPANVLSFALTTASGEILIDREIVRTPSALLKMFIHGLCHLAGYNHGSTMETNESLLYEQFYHRWLGHRQFRHPIGRRRNGARR